MRTAYEGFPNYKETRGDKSMRMHGFFLLGGIMNEKRLAVIGITVENAQSALELNKILHEYGAHIIGRMGVPYENKSVSVITIVLDAPQDVVSSLSGKIGMIKDVNAKTMYLKYNE